MKLRVIVFSMISTCCLTVLLGGCLIARPSENPLKANQSNATVKWENSTETLSTIPFDAGTNKSTSATVPPSEIKARPAAILVEKEAPPLSPGLVVAVTVLVSGKKEIEEPAKRISNAGEISLPLIGNVQVSGMNLDELVTKLTILYKEYFVQPQVAVEFVNDRTDMVFPWGYVTVLGRVKNPGRVSIPPTQDVTISGAIQQAGGLATSAKDSAIRVTRQLPDGRTVQYEVDLRSVGSRGRVDDDLILKPGDVVFVPEMIF